MTRTLLLWALALGASLAGFAQADRGLTLKQLPADTIRTTYALVVGISAYENIARLNYADDDANAFADFLVDQQVCLKKNVVKLIDSAATTANFYKELKKLLTQANKNDRVFIYFAGHGDVENEIESGFLLTYNTEATNYSAGAIDIDMLEKYVNAFVNKNVKVVLITDACRSGNLVGGITGATNTISSLSKGFQNVIKVLSCQPNQLSEERPYPGGGHGVFTYHLIEGLNGLADRQNKGFVSLRDLDFYLENVSEVTGNKQMPKVDGDPQAKVIAYDQELKQAALARKQAGSGNTALAVVKKRNTGDTTWSSNQYFQDFNRYIRKHQLIAPADESSWSVLQQAMRDNQPAALVEEMKLELAAILEDEAQKWINKYIRGNLGTDEAAILQDLHRSKEYLAVVEELIGKDDIRYNDIHIKKVFFETYSAFIQKNKSAYGPAIAKLEEANKLMPGQAWLLHALALVYGELEQHGKEREKDMEALKYSPRWKYAIQSIGLSYHYQGRNREAVKWLREVVELDSNYSYGWNNLGLVYNNLELPEMAIPCLERSIALQPGYKQPWVNLAEAYEKLGQFEKAVSTFKKGIGLDPKDPYVWEQLAAYYKRNDSLGAAIDAYHQALRIDPHYHYPYRNLNDIYEKQENWEAAETILKTGIQYNPQDADLWNDLGLFYQQRGRRDEAVAAFKQGILADSFNVYPINNLAAIYERREQADSVAWALRKLLHLYTTDAFSVIRQIRGAYVYSAAKNVKGFVEFCKSLTEKNPNNLLYWTELASAQEEAKDWMGAVESHRQAFRLDPAKRYLYSIVNCLLNHDETRDEKQVYAEVLGLQHAPEAVLVEIGRHKYYDMDGYTEKTIAPWKQARDWKKISKYFHYLVELEEKNAASWIALAKDYSKHELPKDSIVFFLRTAIRIDSAAAGYDAWPMLAETLNQPAFTTKAIGYLEGQRKSRESYMLLYNLARCYHQAKKYNQAISLLKLARSKYDVVRQLRSDFSGITDEAWEKSFE